MTPGDLAKQMLALVPTGAESTDVIGALAISQRFVLDGMVKQGADREETIRFILDGVQNVLRVELPSQRAAKMN